MSKNDYVFQISIDLDSNKPLVKQEIIEALEKAGYSVAGAAWKATWWLSEDYYKGLPPISSD